MFAKMAFWLPLEEFLTTNQGSIKICYPFVGFGYIRVGIFASDIASCTYVQPGSTDTQRRTQVLFWDGKAWTYHIIGLFKMQQCFFRIQEGLFRMREGIFSIHVRVSEWVIACNNESYGRPLE